MKEHRRLKYGGFSVIITVLVIIAVLAVNVLVSYLEDRNGWKADFTPTRAYTLDKSAETAIRDLTCDVIIYSFIPGGQSSRYSTMTENIVALFDGASERIESKNVDPIVNPSKLEQFSSDTKTLSSFAVVVAQKDNEANYHAFNEDELVEFNSNNSKYYFVLQRWITSALVYMRTGIRQNVYLLTGHGEDIQDASLQVMLSRIRRENFEVQELSLVSGQTTLKQGDVVIVTEPKSDLTENEYNTLIQFLDDHYGSMMIIAARLIDDAGNKLTRYHNLLDYFNLSLEDGVIAETDDQHHQTNLPKNIQLIADQAHVVSSAVRSANEPVWVTEATGITYKYGTGTTIGSIYEEKFSSVLTSYASSVLVPWEYASDFRATDYETGIHTAAGAYERRNTGITGTENTTTTRILILGSQSIATGDYLGNQNILRNGINWLAGKNAGDTLVSVGIDLTSSYVQLTQLQMRIWFAVLVAAVPAALLVAGIVVWIRRRNL